MNIDPRIKTAIRLAQQKAFAELGSSDWENVANVLATELVKAGDGVSSGHLRLQPLHEVRAPKQQAVAIGVETDRPVQS